MLEELLITYCAPTLAGIKTGNLFKFPVNSEKDLMDAIQKKNRKLNNMGIYLDILCIQNSSALILAYRPADLVRDFNKEGVTKFMTKFGYQKMTSDYAVLKLKERFEEQTGFPHESGLFLGYPLEDVVGFIENDGQNSKYTGFWKVYHDEGETVKLFDRYKKCKDIYLKMFAGGCSIMQLIVAA